MPKNQQNVFERWMRKKVCIKKEKVNSKLLKSDSIESMIEINWIEKKQQKREN